MESVRRLSFLAAILACALPQVPRWVESPYFWCFGFRRGSSECAMLGLLLMVAALIGLIASRSSMPPSVRRWDLPLVVLRGVVWIVVIQADLFV